MNEDDDDFDDDLDVCQACGGEGIETAYTPEMAGSGQSGICIHCGKGPTSEGHDGCLSTLPEHIVMNACCGHGNDAQAYIQYRDGECVRGKHAMEEIERLRAEISEVLRND